MAQYQTDEEQIDALKKWWEDNGRSLLLTVGIALVVSFGYQGWRNNVQETGEKVSVVYEDLRDALTASDQLSDSQITTAIYLADSLKKDHADSIYAQFAALQIAKVHVGSLEFEKAETELRWVMGEAKDASIAAIARLRLAKVMGAQGKTDDAIALLDDAKGAAFKASFAELRGDLLVRSKRGNEARQAYLAAQSYLGEGQESPLVRLKLDDLAVAGELDLISATEAVEPESGEE